MADSFDWSVVTEERIMAFAIGLSLTFTGLTTHSMDDSVASASYLAAVGVLLYAVTGDEAILRNGHPNKKTEPPDHHRVISAVRVATPSYGLGLVVGALIGIVVRSVSGLTPLPL